MSAALAAAGLLLALGGAGAESWPTAVIGMALLGIGMSLSHGETADHPREEQ